jgi:uncharacterized peroxidase-related enzyme
LSQTTLSSGATSATSRAAGAPPAADASQVRRKHDNTARPAGSESISRFQVPEPGDLSPELQAIYQRFEQTHGFVPHWLRALSANPDTAYRLVQFYEQLFDPARSRLSTVERELIAVVASATTRCSYCVFNHTRALGRALGDEIRARRIALDHHHVRLSKREQVLAEVTEKLTLQPASVDNAQLDRLLSAGFDEAAALEVLEVAAFFNYLSRLTIALNIVPDSQFFAE